jgi:glycogen debranching enzyme GlgX
MINRRPGSPTPLGATYDSSGWWNFAVYSPHVISQLIIGEYETDAVTDILNLDEQSNRTGDIWHIALHVDKQTLLWAWKIDSRFGAQASRGAEYVVDPFAKLVKTKNLWGDNAWKSMTEKPSLIGVATSVNEYDWGSAHHTPLHPDPLLIYETHVRGWTQDLSSSTEYPGTFLGMIDKLPYLQSLGITAIELLPIYEFDESEWKLHNPITGKRLYNYWGYAPLNFFSPMQRYGTTNDPLATSKELKTFVRACHDKEIAVILDVVYNHTGEGNEHGPAFSFKMLDDITYYIKNSDDTFANYSGCGNTFNVNHPIVTDLIIQSLRHWVLEYRIDGFRFDLASAMTRNQAGIPMTEPPLVEAILKDPVISKCILIAEPWDAAGLYQTGGLYRLNQCHLPGFKEWNDHFRDDVRKFIRGTKGTAGLFAHRMCGSEDIYGPYGSPANTINYISSHDGFSLFDIVCYNTKHNIENGEHNRDGMNENYSWNCGVEGHTDKHAILRLRDRQVKNFFVALFLAQGCPMMLMGDEIMRSKKGNNNTWCQDSPLSWMNWHEVETHANLLMLISSLSALRRESQCFHSDRFLTVEDVQWHGKTVGTPLWDSENQIVAFTLIDKSTSPRLFIAFNASSEKNTIEVPSVRGGAWHCVVNTSKQPPHDVYEIHKGPRLVMHTIEMASHSSIVLYKEKHP